MIHARIDSVISFDATSLPDPLVQQIIADLSPRHPDKDRAVAELIRGSDEMPDQLRLWKARGNEIVLPRGYVHRLESLALSFGQEVEWSSSMTLLPPSEHCFRDWPPFPLRDYQTPAVEAMLDWSQGLVQAPTGCVAGDTKIHLNRAGKGFECTIKDAYERSHAIPFVDKLGRPHKRIPWDPKIKTKCRALVDGIYHQHVVEDIVYSGMQNTIIIELESGKSLQCTLDHKVLTMLGWVHAGNLKVGSNVIVNGIQVEVCVCCGAVDRRLIKGGKWRPAKYLGHCRPCASRLQNTQRKERIYDKDGYVYVHAPDHPRKNVHGYVFEHILIAEKAYGRPVDSSEHVHHINKIHDDNRPENLQILSPHEHHRVHSGFLKMDGGTGGRGGKIVFIPTYERISTIRYGGVVETYDIVMQNPHNNFVANGIVVHNSGKTATALEFSRWAGQRTLVIVGKTNLARQWQEAARERYGYETGYFGEGEWNEKDFSVGLWQTLWTRDIPEAFWKHWGCVIFDEVQHASSNSLSDLAGRFPAFYRIGLSATPRWDPLLFPIVEAVIGPVIHKTVVDDVGEHLLRPEIQQVESNFAAEYVGTHFDGRKRISNNYGEVMATLVADDDRNDLIARIAREEAQAGHQVLIVTRRIEHVKQLVSRLEKVFKIGRDLHALTGAQTGADAQRIGRAIENSEGGSILISTTADEGLDIPRLDRLIMAFPLRRLPLVEQQIGRIVRPASNKQDAIVWDITDPQVGPLKSQRKDRAQFYGRKGWKTKRIEKEGTCLISS